MRRQRPRTLTPPSASTLKTAPQTIKAPPRDGCKVSKSSERPADTRVDRTSVHPEGRLARESLDGVERVDRDIAIGKDVEQVLRAEGERVGAGPVRGLD